MAGEEGGDRGWDGWMTSLTQGTWVWTNSGRQWRTGKPGMLPSTGSQAVRHDLATDQEHRPWTDGDIWAAPGKCELASQATTDLRVPLDSHLSDASDGSQNSTPDPILWFPHPLWRSIDIFSWFSHSHFQNCAHVFLWIILIWWTLGSIMDTYRNRMFW